MKRTLFSAAFALLSASLAVATPPPEKLLPSDALVVLAVPDAAKLREFYNSSPQGRMWQDPAMKPFKDKFMAKLVANFSGPLEKQLGVNLADYADLAQGQAAVAVIAPEAGSRPDAPPAFLFVLDAKDRAKELKSRIAELKKKWADAGKTIKSDQTRGVEIDTISVTPDEFSKLGQAGSPDGKTEDKPDAASKPGAANKTDIVIGQSDTLLIVSTSQGEVERVLARQSGAGVPALGDDAEFQTAQNSLFRDAPFYVWVNLKSAVQLMLKAIPAPSADPQELMAPNPEKIINATGVKSLRGFGLAFKDAPNGRMLVLGVNYAESGPQGLFKIFTPERKDSRPPAFIPADAVKFSRYRLDLQAMWASFEKLATEAYPPAGPSLNLVFQTAGKDKDPNYDLRKELIGNLGDDIIGYEKAPKSSSAQDLRSTPAATFISSPNPEKLIQAIRTAVGTFIPIDAKEREFLGRKIYSLGGSPTQPNPSVYFAANAGYLAIATTPEPIEEFIRTADNPAKSLREKPELTEAADKVGGTDTGFFGYNNESEALKNAWDFIRKNSDDVASALGGMGGPTPVPGLGKVREWVDFSLLPPYEAISKYLTYSVYAGSFQGSGVAFKAYFPDPPGLKK
jgi:hypothetical protein